ncbi:MAG: ATP synthase F1 subunit gamma [Candidatus Levyibacteriota bacterium]
MASTLQLQRRIRSAQNISKTTKAMQMIAASKLKKAQDAALSSRPYVEKLLAVTGEVSKRVEKSARPLYMQERKDTGKTLYVVIGPDKGLCGALVTNLVRDLIKKADAQDSFITVGKKIENPTAHISKNIVGSFEFGTTLPKFDMVYPIVKLIDEAFKSGKIDNVEILSSHFVNVFIQKPTQTHLLPIRPQEEEVEKKETKSENDAFQLFEPNAEELLPDLLTRYTEMAIYQELIESYLSEQSAKLISMQNATNNAKDIIEDLKLEYNKTRQAKITSELLDITGSAVAN